MYGYLQKPFGRDRANALKFARTRSNIKNHYQMNIYRFQNKYLKSKLTIHLHTFMKIELDKKITKSLKNYLTKCCQSAMINNKKINLKLDPKRKENKKLDKDKLEKCLQL